MHANPVFFSFGTVRLSPADAISVSFVVVLRENRLDLIIIPSPISPSQTDEYWLRYGQQIAPFAAFPAKISLLSPLFVRRRVGRLSLADVNPVLFLFDFVRHSPVDANSVSRPRLK